jgi:hypothetical protein
MGHREAAYAQLYKRVGASSRGKLPDMDKADSIGDLPIHYAAACCAPAYVLEAVLAAHPQGASALDSMGNLPIHLLLHALERQKPVIEAGYRTRVETLLAAYPKAVLCHDENSKLPIQIVLDSPCASIPPCKLLLDAESVSTPTDTTKRETQFKLLDTAATLFGSGVSELGISLGVMLGRPYDCDGLADNWLCLLEHSSRRTSAEMYADPGADDEVDFSARVVESIVLDTMAATAQKIERLAYATDSRGREAYAVATKENRRYLWKHLLLLGRYSGLGKCG